MVTETYIQESATPIWQPEPHHADGAAGARAPMPIKAGIMLLLDDGANADLLSECLRSMGYRDVEVAEQPGRARQLLLSELPDLLLLDADLPGDAGFELLAWIRNERPAAPHRGNHAGRRRRHGSAPARAGTGRGGLSHQAGACR